MPDPLNLNKNNSQLLQNKNCAAPEEVLQPGSLRFLDSGSRRPEVRMSELSAIHCLPPLNYAIEFPVNGAGCENPFSQPALF